MYAESSSYVLTATYSFLAYMYFARARLISKPECYYTEKNIIIIITPQEAGTKDCHTYDRQMYSNQAHNNLVHQYPLLLQLVAGTSS